MPIIRKKLAPSEVYPDDIRYNEATDTVQSNINGVWTDSPEADPRRQTTLPPRITSNTACDAAQGVVDALKGQIDQTIVAVDNASTGFTIAGIILSLFTFGVFGIFISIALTIADAMIGAGSAALEAALTEPVYETLKCIIFCTMDSQGRITEDDLAEITGQVNAQIGGLGATILNSMLLLAGEGGINNLASLGTSTGDCSGCDCGLTLEVFAGFPPGNLINLGSGTWRLIGDDRLDDTFTLYVQRMGGGCFFIDSLVIISGSDSPQCVLENAPAYQTDPGGLQCLPWADSAGHGWNWIGYRALAPFTIEIHVIQCP